MGKWLGGRWEGDEPTLLDLGYLSDAACDCCRAERVPLRVSRLDDGRLYAIREATDEPPFWAICDLCAGTMASTWVQYDHERNEAEILKAICHVGNAILRAIHELQPKDS